MTRVLRQGVWIVAFPLLAIACRAALPVQHEASVRPGINDEYKKQSVDTWVERFESESREIYQHRGEIVDAVGPRPGMAIADVGAGTGFFTRMFAERVGPSGRVYAVDILPEFIEHIASRAKEHGLSQVTPVLCKEDSVELPTNSVDLVFMSDTYHHFEYPKSTLASIRRALRPGGEMVVIDFERIEGKSRQWVLDHVRAGEEVVVAEITGAGFERVPGSSEKPFLQENYFLRFRKKGE